MRSSDITKRHLEYVEFKCPIKGSPINFPFSLIEAKVTIIDGKFHGVQLGVQCGICGEFHLSDGIENGFLVLRGSGLNWTE